MKNILLYILLLISCAATAQVKIGADGAMHPTGNYPATQMNEVKSFALTFQTLAQRDAIPANFRDTGMIVVVRDSSAMYSLVGGITNSDWVKISMGGEVIATNGLTNVDDNTIKLGGALTENTSITGGAFGLSVSRTSGTGGAIAASYTSASQPAISATNVSGNAISASGTITASRNSSAATVFAMNASNTQGTALNVSGNSMTLPSMKITNSGSTGTGVPTGLSMESINNSPAEAGSGIAQTFFLYQVGIPALSSTPTTKFTSRWDAGSVLGDNISELVISGADNLTAVDLLTLNATDGIKFNQYGDGTFTGTPTYNLAVDADGNVIEVSGGGSQDLQSVLEEGNTADDISIAMTWTGGYSGLLNATDGLYLEHTDTRNSAYTLDGIGMTTAGGRFIFMNPYDGIRPAPLTTTERDAITGIHQGQIIFNTTVDSLQVNIDPDAGEFTWLNLGGGGSGGSPLFPTTGTGTATGNVTGSIGTNTLSILNSTDTVFKIDATVGREKVILRASSGSSVNSGNFNSGWQDNVIDSGFNNIILWGGSSVYPNKITGGGNYQTVIGAYDNIIDSSTASTIVGGAHHRINDLANHAIIGGGSFDTIFNGNYPVIVGGTDNSSSGNNTVVIGGGANRITTSSHYSSVFGSNQVTIDNTTYGHISGSLSASILGASTGSGIYSGTNSTITSSSTYSTITGARNSIISGSDYSGIGWGRYDSVMSSSHAFAAGDSSKASGIVAVAIGNRAKALANGAWAIADNSVNADLNNSTANSFLSQFAGGYTLNGGAIVTQGGITKRVTSIASSATPTPVASTDDGFKITALAAAAAFASPGAGTQMQELVIRIKDNGTSRGLTWDGIYRASTDLPLPSTTTISKTMYLKFIYNVDDSKWDLVAFLNNF